MHQYLPNVDALKDDPSYELLWEQNNPQDGAYVTRLFKMTGGLRHQRYKYSVQYGLQLDSLLSIEAAGKRIGEAIIHSLGCEGKLD